MDHLSAMRAFVRVVQTGSFSATGREMNTSQTTISKKVAALEKQLGVKLLTRSSRDHSLTQAGAEYYDRCVAIIEQVDEAEALARSQVASPSGTLRVAAPVAFGRILLAPLLPRFFEIYPDIRVHLALSDRHVDLISEGVDVAIRASHLEDSSLVARKLFDNPMVLAASPHYLERHGTPETPLELKRHQCLIYTRLKQSHQWTFYHKGREAQVPVDGKLSSDNGDVLLDLARAGQGVTLLPEWMVAEDVQRGDLVPILEQFSGRSLPFSAIYPQNRFVPLKTRCFIDFVRESLEQT